MVGASWGRAYYDSEGKEDGRNMQPRVWKADVDAIRPILLSEWDPIGCHVPDDEYDMYIPAIYLLMQARVHVEELAAHLQEIETGRMGLRPRPEVNTKVAEMLLALMG
jgi:hypothetical protein